ncbi:pyridoxal-phosphate dependent enzyme [Amycolatopsis sp. PS_44_ISF1]|uniref:threonine synthase n=1 Tax=Amycolatopsis sp. PS_44_ISF1 TaxID=2974917 RepID=UPI0028DEDD07|nr:pyridoxal-phosphate dependent enzyme [Amycolatopsis sp. PS_44_ISF1]MDT8912416.1 pyridoxal-phosphate dependent enzyme [Amycolatopsis sp. PS_44_ISF1]
MKLICENCSERPESGSVDGPSEWRCTRCDGALTESLPEVRSWADAVTDTPGVGRYAALLPVSAPDDLRSSEKALIPVESPQLAAALGVASVRLMPQTLNDTGTFKDNEGVLLAAKCVEWGLSSVCMHSSGNTARSYQYYMERLGVACTAFVPQPSAYKCPTTAMGKSRVVAVPGNMVNAADAAIAHSKEHGAFRLTPSQWKIEGKVPVGLAIAERCPDATLIAVTIASGYGPLGFERGIRRARAAGLTAPGEYTYHLFQAADAGLLGAALRDGRDEIDLGDMVAPEDAFEPTLQSTNPNRTLPLVRRLVAETGACIDPVEPSRVEAEAPALIDACAELGIPLAYELEKSAFICWGGLRQAAESGRLSADDRVVMIVSGSRPQNQLP